MPQLARFEKERRAYEQKASEVLGKAGKRSKRIADRIEEQARLEGKT